MDVTIPGHLQGLPKFKKKSLNVSFISIIIELGFHPFGDCKQEVLHVIQLHAGAEEEK